MEFREDLPFFLNKLGLTDIGVEVGVLRGEFSGHILKHWKGKKLYLVDSWRHISGVIDINNPDHNGHLDNMAKTFMSVYHYQERAVMLRDLSESAASLFPVHSLDFVYIDAAHDYENVTKDLHVWYPTVKAGGLLMGHDYLDSKKAENGHSEFEVKRAVDEFAAAHGLTVQCTPEENYPTWWIQL